MALDQRTIDCLALDAQLSPVFRRDGEAVVPERTAEAFNELWRPGLQAFADEMVRTFPRQERAYELAVLTSYQGRGTGHHSILVCTDGRVVYAETEVGIGLARFHEFEHGKLVIRTRLRTLRPEIQLGARPALVWPGLAGSEGELQGCLDAPQPEPASHLRSLLARLDGGDEPRLGLVATGGAEPAVPKPKAQPPTGDYLEHAVRGAVTSTLRGAELPEGAADGAAEGVEGDELPPPPGWYPDPTDRQDHRWWDGAAWTDHASRNGVSLVDPLAR